MMIPRTLAPLCLAVTVSAATAADLKPYLLAGAADGPLDTARATVEEHLAAAGFEVLGGYAPAEEESLHVLCVTHPRLTAPALEYGGLHGFAAVLRIGLHAAGDTIQVSSMNPAYWGNAYYRKAFPNVAEDYAEVDRQLRQALSATAAGPIEPFGSEKGVSEKKLRKYHYMMAMPYFDDVEILDEGSDYADAVARIQARAADPESEIDIVYTLTFPEQEMALFGTALHGERGEAHFLPVIDTGTPRHVPFLPYEMLVLSDRVVSLHGKFRIALSFPDLGMGTFMKIMSTPGDIAEAQRTLVTP